MQSEKPLEKMSLVPYQSSVISHEYHTMIQYPKKILLMAAGRVKEVVLSGAKFAKRVEKVLPENITKMLMMQLHQWECDVQNYAQT